VVGRTGLGMLPDLVLETVVARTAEAQPGTPMAALQVFLLQQKHEAQSVVSETVIFQEMQSMIYFVIADVKIWVSALVNVTETSCIFFEHSDDGDSTRSRNPNNVCPFLLDSYSNFYFCFGFGDHVPPRLAYRALSASA